MLTSRVEDWSSNNDCMDLNQNLGRKAVLEKGHHDVSHYLPHSKQGICVKFIKIQTLGTSASEARSAILRADPEGE